MLTPTHPAAPALTRVPVPAPIVVTATDAGQGWQELRAAGITVASAGGFIEIGYPGQCDLRLPAAALPALRALLALIDA